MVRDRFGSGPSPGLPPGLPLMSEQDGITAFQKEILRAAERRHAAGMTMTASVTSCLLAAFAINRFSGDMTPRALALWVEQMAADEERAQKKGK